MGGAKAPDDTNLMMQLSQQYQTAQQQMATALQSQSQGDMASLMARYGARLALSAPTSQAAQITMAR